MSEKIFVTAEAHFDAAHRLEYYSGKCARLHGHRWVIRATVGPFNEDDMDPSGIVVDFTVVKTSLEEFAGQFDHQYINDIISGPSAERLGLLGYRYLKALLKLPIYEVRVYESPDAYAIVRG